MAKKICFTKEQNQEIQRKFCRVKNRDNAQDFKRLQVLNMRRLGCTNAEISVATGFHAQYITDLVSLYNKNGMSAIVGNHYTSHNRRLTFEQETELLEQFRAEAEAGQLITVEGILAKFEEETGKKSNTSTIYKLLKRHGWRKVKPRPRHPGAATKEEQDSSKKLTQFGEKSYWKNMT